MPEKLVVPASVNLYKLYINYAQILSHLSQIDTQDSDVELYLQKVLHNGINGNTLNENNKNDHLNGTPDSGIELRTPRCSVSIYKTAVSKDIKTKPSPIQND